MKKELAVITGAGTGIGRATVGYLARAGYDVVLIGRDETRLKETARKEVENTGQRFFIRPCDVRDGEALWDIAQQVEAEAGEYITVWINCAGATIISEAAYLKFSDVRKALEITALGSINGTLVALHYMRRRGFGHIINLDLDLELRDLPLTSCENAARSAIRGFCNSVRDEIEHNGDNIALTLVEIPSTNTPFYNWTKNTTGKAYQPIGEIYDPEVIALAIGKALKKPSTTISIGWGAFWRNLAQRICPFFHAYAVQKHGYDQLSHDWLREKPENDLDQLSKAPYGLEGAYGAKAHRLDSPFKMIMSGHMREILAHIFGLCGLTFLILYIKHLKKLLTRNS